MNATRKSGLRCRLVHYAQEPFDVAECDGSSQGFVFSIPSSNASVCLDSSDTVSVPIQPLVLCVFDSRGSREPGEPDILHDGLESKRVSVQQSRLCEFADIQRCSLGEPDTTGGVFLLPYQRWPASKRGPYDSRALCSPSNVRDASSSVFRGLPPSRPFARQAAVFLSDLRRPPIRPRAAAWMFFRISSGQYNRNGSVVKSNQKW